MKNFYQIIIVLFMWLLLTACGDEEASDSNAESDEKDAATNSAGLIDQSNSVWFKAKQYNNETLLFKWEEPLTVQPKPDQCLNNACTKITVGASRYHQAIPITEDNYQELLVGTWTADECSRDIWHLSENGYFYSFFVEYFDGESALELTRDETSLVYIWHGRFAVKGDKYIELGRNNREEIEHNVADVYYIPALKRLLYKGTLSYMAAESGVDQFEYYTYTKEDWQELPTFMRCEDSPLPDVLSAEPYSEFSQ